MAKPLVMIGAGGHAAVLAELLLAQGKALIAVVSPDSIKANSPLAALKKIDNDNDALSAYPPHEVDLVNGIGSIPGNNTRFNVFNFFKTQGYYFPPVISSNAMLSKYLELEEGVQVMMGALIQTNVKIKKNSIINTGAIIEHDCIIGEHNHIAPGAVLCGGVVSENNVHIGTGAVIIQGLHIQQHAVIGAGTTVARNVSAEQKLIPARSRALK